MSEEEKSVNQFEELDEEMDDMPPPTTAEGVPPSTEAEESLIASGTPGQVYDWNEAPDGTKAPPRVDLDGQELIINKAEIILPPLSTEWGLSRDKKTKLKSCSFKLHYDKDGQQEFYSGVKVFNNEGKYSHPTIMRDGKSQASALLAVYAKFKDKDINEVSLKEFMSFLNSKPKVKIVATEFENPTDETKVLKNIIGSFL